MIVIKDVTKEYRQLAKPGYGEVTFSPNYEQRYHRDEIIAAEWLHQEFGGDLCLLTEVDRTKVKTPDYLWRGKKWERKGISSCKFNTINKRIREAYEQIRDNRGGILLDFTGCNLYSRKKNYSSCQYPPAVYAEQVRAFPSENSNLL